MMEFKITTYLSIGILILLYFSFLFGFRISKCVDNNNKIKEISLNRKNKSEEEEKN